MIIRNSFIVLSSHLKQSGSKFLPQLLDRFQEIVPLTLVNNSYAYCLINIIVQNDAGGVREELALAALQFLGYSLFDQPLADMLVQLLYCIIISCIV